MRVALQSPHLKVSPYHPSLSFPIRACCLGHRDVLLKAIEGPLRLLVLLIKVKTTEQQAYIFTSGVTTNARAGLNWAETCSFLLKQMIPMYPQKCLRSDLGWDIFIHPGHKPFCTQPTWLIAKRPGLCVTCSHLLLISTSHWHSTLAPFCKSLQRNTPNSTEKLPPLIKTPL